MGGDDTRRPAAPSATGAPRPGALTELLAELVRAPAGAGWEEPPHPGEQVGRFEIVREIGRGGFGVVYEALDRELSRSVAFKAVQSCAEEACGARVVAEAEAAARLAHPNIVHLYDLGHSERGAWLIMELLRGRSLADRLAEGPLPVREAVRVAVEIARGLAHAHAQGVVHRDLKPSNVFLCDDGQVKVLDFGLARVFGRAGAAGGTPGYMAPEQAAGAPGDERSDLFSLGKVVADLVPPGARGVQAALPALVNRLTAQDPALRPTGGAEALGALLAIQRTLEPKRLLKASLAMTLLAVAGACAFAWFWQRPLPEGRLLTALADTDNRTGDPDLDGLSELFRLGLDQSARVSVMARSRLLNLLGGEAPPDKGSVDERAAGVAADRAKAHLLLTIDVRHEGGGLLIGARAVDVVRRLPAFTVRETAATKAGVLDALDRLLAKVRRELRDQSGAAFGPAVRVADAAPANPEAWRHYLAWQRARSEGRGDDPAALERLLAIDPEFPVARLVQALNSGQNFGANQDQEQAHVDAALRGLGRLPPKERAIVEAMLGPYTGGTLSDRRRALEQVAATWPEDTYALEFLCMVILMNDGDLAAARPYLERAVAAAPLPPMRAVTFYTALGDLDGALARARRWAEEAPTKLALSTLSSVHRWRGEREEALAAARRSLADGEPPGLARRWAWLEADALSELEAHLRGTGEERSPEWLSTRGRWREALVALDGELPANAAPAARGWHHWQRLELLANAGAPPATLWREVEGQLWGGTDMLGASVLPLAAAGDLDGASRLARSLGSETTKLTRMYQALERRAKGDREGALRRVEAIAGAASGYFRGLLLAELGRHQEAVAAFRAYRRAPDVPGAETYYLRFTAIMGYARSLYLEAVSLEALGERAEARQVLGRLLRLWEKADPELPLRRDMLALQRKLAGAGP